MKSVTIRKPELIGIIVLDIETTGLNYAQDHVLEIAAVQVLVHSLWTKVLFNEVCNPGIPKEELELSYSCQQGYFTAEEILEGIPPQKLALMLKGVIGNWPWTSYNDSFEWGFLQKAPWKLHPPKFDLMDTMTNFCGSWSRWSNRVRSPKLGKAYHHIGGRGRPTHRALSDAQMAAEILTWLLKNGYYKRETLGNILIPPIERPQCNHCKATMHWEPFRNDWDCSWCREYHFRLGGGW